MEIFDFRVTVAVENNDPAGKWEERNPLSYARAALESASLRRADMLDGFADLTSDAYIRDVEPL